MRLYDELIGQWLSMDSVRGAKQLCEDFLSTPCGWEEISDRSMILRSEMAYELGGSNLPAVGMTLLTANPEFVPKNGVYLIGKDLGELSVDTPYARVAVVLVDEEAMGEGQKLYYTTRNLEYTRYHFYPEGFMMRVSAAQKREGVRIGQEALKRGLSFAKTGNLMGRAFCKHPQVLGTAIYYVTDPDFDFAAVQRIAREGEDITKTIDHILKNVMTDCSSCSLQKICDEVEGLRELHFKNK